MFRSAIEKITAATKPTSHYFHIQLQAGDSGALGETETWYRDTDSDDTAS